MTDIEQQDDPRVIYKPESRVYHYATEGETATVCNAFGHTNHGTATHTKYSVEERIEKDWLRVANESDVDSILNCCTRCQGLGSGHSGTLQDLREQVVRAAGGEYDAEAKNYMNHEDLQLVLEKLRDTDGDADE